MAILENFFILIGGAALSLMNTIRNLSFKDIEFKIDSDNKEIDRELVGRMLAWAHLSLPEIKLKERIVPYINETVKDALFLKEVQQLITEHNFEIIPEKAFSYQKEEMQFMTIRGLQKQESGSFDIVAFGFFNGNIIKIPCTFNDNLNELIPQV